MKKRTTGDDLKELFRCAQSSIPPFCLEMLIMVWMVPLSYTNEKKMVISWNTLYKLYSCPSLSGKHRDSFVKRFSISVWQEKNLDSLFEDFATSAYGLPLWDNRTCTFTHILENIPRVLD